MYAKKCQCGAVTVSGEDFDNSMTQETFEKEFPGLDIEGDLFSNCNHCVNHWGIDLCGCGSGEPLGECQEGFNECENKIPAQVKSEQRRFLGWAR